MLAAAAAAELEAARTEAVTSLATADEGQVAVVALAATAAVGQ